jgi:PAS domain-containing protein
MKTALAPSPATLALLHKLTQRQPQVVFVYQVSSQGFDYVNPGFETVWDRTGTSILENPALLRKTVHPADLPYLEECYGEIFEDQKKTVEFRILLPDKGERHIHLNAFLVRSDTGEAVIVGIGEDMTARKPTRTICRSFPPRKTPSWKFWRMTWPVPSARFRA